MNQLKQAFETLQNGTYQDLSMNESLFIGYFTRYLTKNQLDHKTVNAVLTTACNMYFGNGGKRALTNIIQKLETNFSHDYSASFIDQLINHYFSTNYDHNAKNVNELDNFGQIIMTFKNDLYQTNQSDQMRYLTFLSGMLYIEAQSAIIPDFLEEHACELEELGSTS